MVFLNTHRVGFLFLDTLFCKIDAKIYGEIEISISRETCEKCNYAYSMLFYAVRHSLTVRKNRNVIFYLYGDSDEHCDAV